MKQRTAEWYEARLGKATASHISDVMARTKSGYSEKRNDYMVDLVCERLTGEVAEHYVSQEMEWGIAQEENAITEYELATGRVVERVGFVDHPEIPMSGASPDGLVGEDGLIEVKCPKTKTHLKTVMGQEIDGDYVLQMQWQMDCKGRKWCDFVSYDPRLPGNLQLEIRRIYRDPAIIAVIRREVTTFLTQLEAFEQKLRDRLSADSVIYTKGDVVPPASLKEGEVF